MDPQGVFQPQQTLSFPQHVAYLSPDAARTAPPDPERPHEPALPAPADLAVDLEQAMRLPLVARPAVAAADVERLFADVADRFFDAHQYDYPQTVQLYEAFKASFASERLIRLRSAPARDPPPEAPLQALALRRRPSSRHRQVSQPPQHQPQHQPSQHQQHQNQQQHGFHAEERVPVPMDNLFVRLRARLRAYADDGLWQGSELRLASELRRLWEQNKLMLS
ncbi:hypothetical protein METBIDRAFT_11639 [Metschnikowia bicuspidata var. bicuspidata NRRL YB-4993]|uniref:Uncharacterized protein n=1 Tax=Metschnikowia bicuspidata var. bicuspidata NRRL YB-4993 TaxID=869754 RepID=A0A1A0HAL7_9ASCO|nr:hypothetical protein METBIDRAFT_11639 [Metschnikowia bicuspidata var. bicuspidata NRRL YB-4993]OBA21056.1 hypothetical protein METBIDRAFT_11639 [Metschnikowia bicuspidata var. bicuspidata NRRL YB-4993]